MQHGGSSSSTSPPPPDADADPETRVPPDASTNPKSKTVSETGAGTDPDADTKTSRKRGAAQHTKVGGAEVARRHRRIRQLEAELRKLKEDFALERAAANARTFRNSELVDDPSSNTGGVKGYNNLHPVGTG